MTILYRFDMSELSKIQTPEPSPGQILLAVAQGGITSENVGVVEKIIQLQRELRAEDAKREFAQALAAFQAETGQIQAMTAVNKAESKGGGVMYKYAKLEQIMRTVQPLLAKHGFSHSFDTITDEGSITAIFELTHRGGHSKQNRFTSRIPKGLNTNAAQDDMGGKSYAKRGALCDGLGIVISNDNDARTVDHGEFVPAKVAGDLRMRLMKTKRADREAATLKWLGAPDWESIPLHKLGALEAQIEKAEKETEAQQLVPEDEGWK